MIGSTVRTAADLRLPGLVPYGEALRLQHDLRDALAEGRGVPTVLILEHPPVVTTGRRGPGNCLRVSRELLEAEGIDYAETDRGGEATAHEPGQLTAYPILDLGRLGLGVKDYVGALEEAMLGLAASYGVKAVRREGYPGVWSGEAKLGAVGVRISRGVTTHGLALNVSNNLSTFRCITPCGIEGVRLTTLSELAGRRIETREAAPRLAEALAAALGLDFLPSKTPPRI